MICIQAALAPVALRDGASSRIYVDLLSARVRGIRFSAAASHLAVRERERERAVFALELFDPLAQSLAGRLERAVRREMRFDNRAGLVLRYCAFELFYSSFQRGDLVGFGLGRHI